MNRSILLRLSFMLIATLLSSGCHSWTPDHTNCVVVDDIHYSAETTKARKVAPPPRMTSKMSGRFGLTSIIYNMMPEAEAATMPGGIILDLAVRGYEATQTANQMIKLANSAAALASTSAASGQAAEAAYFQAQSTMWRSHAAMHSARAKAAFDSLAILGYPVTRVLSGLHVILPPDKVMEQIMNGNMNDYDMGMYYYDQANSSDRGYDHMQGVGILDAWLADRTGGGGNDGGGDDGDICEYDKYYMPSGDPKTDDPCNDHRHGSIVPRTEEPTGTFTLQTLVESSHWLSVVTAMQQSQLESSIPMVMVYESKVMGFMEFPFIRAFTMVWPDGHSSTYYQDPATGETRFAFGAEINAQFIDLDTGEAYGEMFPGQDEVTAYVGEMTYGINYQ
ncbi:hypothetical protein HON52_00960 [Candidatus Uhrbacteria bacterium]|jgi:hypothetical protein|nr:hypothetical protein [Candidatus Uhrbacteria bacterium]